MLDAGVTAPLIARLPIQRPLPHPLSRVRESARQVPHQSRQRRDGGGADEQFSTICGVARDHGKPVRIGVNGGSLNQELVGAKMQENTDRNLGATSEEIINECMVLSAVQFDRARARIGPAPRSDHHLVQDLTPEGSDRRVIASCRGARQPLHLGLTKRAWARRAWFCPPRRWGRC